MTSWGCAVSIQRAVHVPTSARYRHRRSSYSASLSRSLHSSPGVSRVGLSRAFFHRNLSRSKSEGSAALELHVRFGQKQRQQQLKRLQRRSNGSGGRFREVGHKQSKQRREPAGIVVDRSANLIAIGVSFMSSPSPYALPSKETQWRQPPPPYRRSFATDRKKERDSIRFDTREKEGGIEAEASDYSFPRPLGASERMDACGSAGEVSVGSARAHATTTSVASVGLAKAAGPRIIRSQSLCGPPCR